MKTRISTKFAFHVQLVPLRLDCDDPPVTDGSSPPVADGSSREEKEEAEEEGEQEVELAPQWPSLKPAAAALAEVPAAATAAAGRGGEAVADGPSGVDIDPINRALAKRHGNVRDGLRAASDATVPAASASDAAAASDAAGRVVCSFA